MISRSASRRAYRSSWPNGRARSRATSSRTAPPTREKSSISASRLHTDARGSVAHWSSACSRNLPGWASARCISKCGHRTRRPGSCTSRSASARSRAGRGTTGARSRTRWFCGLPLLQRGGLQNFSTSGEIGRAHVRTPVTVSHLVCRLLLEKKKKHQNHLTQVAPAALRQRTLGLDVRAVLVEAGDELVDPGGVCCFFFNDRPAPETYT